MGRAGTLCSTCPRSRLERTCRAPPVAFGGRNWGNVVETERDFVRLLRNSLLALVACAALVALAYVFIDRPVAFYVHNHGLSEHRVLRWLTYPPPVVLAWAPALLAALMVRRAWGPFSRWERAALAACVGVILADQCRESLGHLFGRTWPETWTNDNPSLIKDGVFGFHPLHGGAGYESFPSGHMTITTAAAAAVWIAFPRWRWACVLAVAAVAVGLVGMDYHFVSDVIAGGFVGGVFGAYTVCMIEVKGDAGAHSG